MLMLSTVVSVAVALLPCCHATSMAHHTAPPRHMCRRAAIAIWHSCMLCTEW